MTGASAAGRQAYAGAFGLRAARKVSPPAKFQNQNGWADSRTITRPVAGCTLDALRLIALGAQQRWLLPICSRPPTAGLRCRCSATKGRGCMHPHTHTRCLVADAPPCFAWPIAMAHPWCKKSERRAHWLPRMRNTSVRHPSWRRRWANEMKPGPSARSCERVASTPPRATSPLRRVALLLHQRPAAPGPIGHNGMLVVATTPATPRVADHIAFHPGRSPLGARRLQHHALRLLAVAANRTVQGRHSSCIAVLLAILAFTSWSLRDANSGASYAALPLGPPRQFALAMQEQQSTIALGHKSLMSQRREQSVLLPPAHAQSSGTHADWQMPATPLQITAFQNVAALA